ncbi:metallophosphoesterase [Microbacterium sp. NC79]|uniref:metallophosphoesterase family protein n=1 Tax=Microbacterium sp. NC79 TaxID=2851009 RepID=UPI001C2C57D8|nr:metallophosphoesterase [Microbacterium sp. NC79]MBV0896019.1 metallophosphoesterase [Microbacterium sp. NC79]
MTSLRILHLTDTHLFGDNARHYDTVDTAAQLTAALAHVAEQPCDLVVVAGDVSEDGTVESYQRARTIVGEWARERDARAVFTMGNHDRREAFREVLGGGQPDAHERVLAGTDPARPIASVTESNGWRVIVLDTSVPARGYGDIEAEQLTFLRDILATPAENGTVIVMHHAPVDAQTDLLQALALDPHDADEFIEIIAGSDVRVVLSGHYHHPIVETVNGIPVVVAPGVANIARSLDDPAEESAELAFGGAVIEIRGTRTRVVPFIERHEAALEVFRFDRETVARIIAAAGRPTP